MSVRLIRFIPTKKNKKTTKNTSTILYHLPENILKFLEINLRLSDRNWFFVVVDKNCHEGEVILKII
jgi:hypothetical protein